MTEIVQDPVDCRAFEQNLFAYQASELSLEGRRRMEAHRDACRACASRLEIEASFLQGLRGRLGRTSAPPGLETRIRAALREQAPTAVFEFRKRIRGPWLAASAAAALLIGLLVALPEFRPPEGPSRERAVAVRQEGTIVDIDCDREGWPVEVQRNCLAPDHLNALRIADGSYVHFSLDGRAARKLAGDRGLRGVRVAVSGDLYPWIRTMRVDGYEPLATPETAAWRNPTPGARF